MFVLKGIAEVVHGVDEGEHGLHGVHVDDRLLLLDLRVREAVVVQNSEPLLAGRNVSDKKRNGDNFESIRRLKNSFVERNSLHLFETRALATLAGSCKSLQTLAVAYREAEVSVSCASAEH